MVQAGVLIAHAGATKVGRDVLQALPKPEPKGPRHHPVPHIDLVESIERAASDRGLEIDREEFAVQRGADLIFGVMDFKRVPGMFDRLLPGEDGCLSLGFRAGNGRRMSLQAVAGARVFVCDNLCFSGDMIALQRKHTTGLNLDVEIDAALDRYLAHAGKLSDELNRLGDTEVSDDEAKVVIFDAFEGGALPPTKLPHVIANYFHPTAAMTDCQPRTLWGVHNACTRIVRDMKPRPAFEATTLLGKLFGIGTEN